MPRRFEKQLIKENELEMLKLIKQIDKNKYFITQKKYGKSLDNITELKLTKKELEENILFLIKSLKFLHKNNITHRDINFRNILYKTGEKMKFADFGLSITKEKTKKLMLQKYKTIDDYLDSYYLLYPGYISEHLSYEKYKPLYYELIDDIYDEKTNIDELNKILKEKRRTLLKDINFSLKFYKKEDTIDLNITIQIIYKKYLNYDIKELSKAHDDEFTLTQIEKIIKKNQLN